MNLDTLYSDLTLKTKTKVLLVLDGSDNGAILIIFGPKGATGVNHGRWRQRE